MKLVHCMMAAALLGSVPLQALACYTVYGEADRILYRSTEPPVDMSRPIHETVPRQFPGGHLVFDLASDCAQLPDPLRAPATASSSRLLTDRATANALGVPYTAAARDIVVVEPAPAGIKPRVNTIPAGARLAGPARGTVITELRNPPLTIVETDEGVRTGRLAR